MMVINNKDISCKDFYLRLRAQKGIEALWEKVLEMLRQFCNFEESHPALKILCLYFSLLDDGNTCICLNPQRLFDKWISKWRGLLLVSELNQSEEEKVAEENYFQQVIKEGIASINNGECQAIIGENDKPFLVKNIHGENWLFASKYFAAKISIENRVRKIFSEEKKTPLSESGIQETIEYFKKVTEAAVCLEAEQAKIIVRGETSNLIVTGGPGTGKTTAICYLLWKLFGEKDSEGNPYLDYKLYLAAPSGKAAERMKESISSSLNGFKEEVKNSPENIKIVEKLSTVDSYTVHRLLNYHPGRNSFYYNLENQFDEKSIFIIDEASMIDIQLFKNLLEAIPNKARLFILGDKDQLPSVQAGGVLGDLISKIKGNIVDLIKSKRFNSNSQVGRLKEEINRNSSEKKVLRKEDDSFGLWLDSPGSFDFSRASNSKKTEEAEKNPVFFYSLKNPENKKEDKSKKDQLKSILSKWSKTFCEDLAAKAVFENRNISETELKALWSLVNEAKILCAERQGFLGVEEINTFISKVVCRKSGIQIDDEDYFEGQPLILIQNQKLFRLYNGDTGIVVRFKDTDSKYLMIEKKAGEEDSKAQDEQDLFFRIGDFIFYTLSLLPRASIETAYAITIHKSQGSGYDNILVILPEQVGHPLLNRQIVYTAVTRTGKNTYVITSLEALNYAINTIIQRDTMIELGGEEAS